MFISRRRLLTGAAALPLAAALVGCAGQSASDPLAQLKVAVAALVTGLGNLQTTLAPLALPAAVTTAIGTSLAAARRAAGALGAISGATDAQPVIKVLVGALGPVLSAVAGVAGLPSGVTLALAAVATLIPFVEQLAGLPTPKAMARPAMTPQQAIAILRSPIA